MRLQGKVTKIDDEKFLVFGWASVADVEDSQGDVIKINELEKAAYNYVLTSRTGGAMHEVMGVAKLVESIVFTPEKLEMLGLSNVLVKKNCNKKGYNERKGVKLSLKE